MPDVTIAYKNSTITSLSSSGAVALSTAGKYLEDDLTITYTQPLPNLESISIKPENCTSINTQITPETIVLEDDSLPGQSSIIGSYGIISDFKQSNGIKLESGKTYHCIAHVFVKWDDDDTEEYCYAESDFINNETNIILGNFSWEGSNGAIQTITSITLQTSSSDRYWTRLRIDRNTSTYKRGVLLPGSFYRITQVNVEGYGTINLDFNSDPRFYNIQQSLAYRNSIASNAQYVSEWCNSLSSIASFQFAGQPLSGDFIFSNVSNIEQYAFAWNYTGGFTGGTTAYNLTFPILSSFYYNAIFGLNRGLKSIYCPLVTSIGAYTFYSCFSLSSAIFPECITIGSSAFQYCSNLTTISFPKCITIGNSAFNGCKSLTTISFPECTTINNHTFYSCISLTTVSFPECTTIGNYAFYSCRSLTTISFPKCTAIGSSTFYNCTSLTTISFPECTTIGICAFQNCSNLTTISFPECTTIGNFAFQYCSSLNTASFPECTTIGNNTFYSCSNLTTVSFPKCTAISNSAFQNCSNLTTISFPECTTINSNAFQNCSNLTTISFPKCTIISNYAFSSCQKLESAYFMGSSIISLGTYVFNFTPMSVSSYLGYFGSIYVPSSLLASYKTATNWAAYSARMVGI